MRAIVYAILVAILCPIARASAEPAAKKLIEYGWDVPNPAFIRDNISEMQKRPFDGLILRMAVGGRILVPGEWAEGSYASDIRILSDMDWGTLSENFIVMYAASEIDWFNDAHWQAAERNAAITARAAKAGKCRGVCFDAEPYGKNPWLYSEQPQADTKSFAEFQAKYRKRGAQFMRAVEAEMPEAVVHTFFLFTFMRGLWDIDDDAKRNTELARHSYGLYPAFIDGMLDAAGPSITITDGNESAYYYEDTETFFSARQGMKTDALSMVAPENVPEYRAHVRVANALYVDHLFNLRTQEYLSAYMTPEERAKWFEHNVYYALRTSDEFVWLYSEKMNWWTDEGLPPGLEEAVISARGKIAAREPLGYDIAPMIEEARAREEAAIREALVTRSAEIARVAGEVPTIDGVLSDAAWASVEPLEPMLPTLRGRTDEPAQTECRVTYDDKAMYFALRCVEPQTEAIVAIGDGRDDSVWLGDSVDIFIEPSAQAPTHYHFIIGAGGVAWDARVTDAQDLEYDPTWQHAVNIGTGEWTVEASIPWAAVGMAPPKAGATCRANICRQRASVGGELSSWSQCVGGFVEPDSFGSWVLR